MGVALGAAMFTLNKGVVGRAGYHATFGAAAVFIRMTVGAGVDHIHQRTALGADAIFKEMSVGAGVLLIGWKNRGVRLNDTES